MSRGPGSCSYAWRQWRQVRTHHLEDALDDPVRPRAPGLVSVYEAGSSLGDETTMSGSANRYDGCSQLEDLVEHGKLKQLLVEFAPRSEPRDAGPLQACYARCELEVGLGFQRAAYVGRAEGCLVGVVCSRKPSEGILDDSGVSWSPPRTASEQPEHVRTVQEAGDGHK